MSGIVSALWAAIKFRWQRDKHLPAPEPLHRPGSDCAHVAPARRAGSPAPLWLVASDTSQGYCGFCGQNPYGCCRRDGGDAA